ncbi:MAG: hypothetical protein F4090_03010 [Nitrospira sp. SB0672_bin_25]|nr:hypothetical protein [Nitrospira sp. SB0666_bin_27]MYC26432.1 hypothetical protein [Nitrospira sp. SB0662_bin_26]MYF25648.1 hypothetical protein [Nitrospira sp. SB0678_bin_10]MYJ53868.1 hypothetical protein [Nitrospira sp. SB0672_bin_25]
MDDQLMQAYLDVERSMQHYNEVLNQYLISLESTEGADAKKLERMTAGTKAMKDSSGIYLSYAKFVAYGMPESEDLIEEEDDLQA